MTEARGKKKTLYYNIFFRHNALLLLPLSRGKCVALTKLHTQSGRDRLKNIAKKEKEAQKNIDHVMLVCLFFQSHILLGFSLSGSVLCYGIFGLILKVFFTVEENLQKTQIKLRQIRLCNGSLRK